MGLRESGRHVAAYMQEALPGAADGFVIEEEGDRYDVFYTGGDSDYRQHVGMAETWRGAVREKESMKALDAWEFAEFLDGSYEPGTTADEEITADYAEQKDI